MEYTKENYQEFVLDYLENLMSSEERSAFQNFLEQNPLIKAEIDDLSIVTLPPFEPTYLHKDALIKPVAAKATMFPIYLRRIAAAILLLLMVSIFWLNRKDNVQDLASTPNKASAQDQNELTSAIDQDKEEAQLVAKDVAPEELKSTTPVSDRPAKRNSRNEKRKGQDLAVSDPNPGKQSVTLSQNQDLPQIKLELEIATPELEDINVAKRKTVVFIDQLSIQPVLVINPKLSAVREPMLKTEEIEQESRTKIGKLLAKANLLPSGLREEIASGGLRDKIIPESYTDSK